MTRAAGLVALALALAVAAPARADSYRLQIAAADTAGDGALIGGIWGQSTPVVYGGLGIYLLGGPAVHAFHHDWADAAESLGVRAAVPMATGFVAVLFCKPGRGVFGKFRCVGQGGVGIAVGMLAAEAIDIFVISKPDQAAAQPLMLHFGGHF
jgi:hypothetical protein